LGRAAEGIDENHEHERRGLALKGGELFVERRHFSKWSRWRGVSERRQADSAEFAGDALELEADAAGVRRDVGDVILEDAVDGDIDGVVATIEEDDGRDAREAK
jgi:hypothetical protein